MFDLINISCSNLDSLRRHFSGRYIFPATLNNLSKAAEEAGMDKTFSAVFEILG